jgi:hypothetical protein
VAPEFNGVPFDTAFESWKPVSFTHRGDNNTFRFILGNDVAVKAAQSGNIFPWPDGARFAKIAWQQEMGTDGLLHPGKFLQVELMLKSARLYKDTEGWGWGRWRGMDLKPYGEGANFVRECTGCHQPLRGNDYVYTLPISAANGSRDEVLNRSAALPATLPFQPLAWSAITMYVDPLTHDGNALRQRCSQASCRGAWRNSCGRRKGPGVLCGCGAGPSHLGAAGRSALVWCAHSRCAAVDRVRAGSKRRATSRL